MAMNSPPLSRVLMSPPPTRSVRGMSLVSLPIATMASKRAPPTTISSIFDTLDLIAGGDNQTEGSYGGSGESGGDPAGSALSEHTSASAHLLAKRKEDSLTRNSIHIPNVSASSAGPLKSSVIFDHVSNSSVASPKYWKAGTGKGTGRKKSNDGRLKVQHKSKPQSKFLLKKREKGERYSDRREWKLTGNAK